MFKILINKFNLHIFTFVILISYCLIVYNFETSYFLILKNEVHQENMEMQKEIAFVQSGLLDKTRLL